MSATPATTPSGDLQRIAAFRAAFARRQAAEATEIPGGVLVLDPVYAASHEHNQLVITSMPSAAGLRDLPALADAGLGHLRHRRVSILDDDVATACAPALAAAGYEHQVELVMTASGPGAGTDEHRTRAAHPVALAELRPAVLGQLRRWMPQAPDDVVRQLADRRAARRHGADRVRFLAVRDEEGVIGSWADLYLDPESGIAQLEEVATSDTHTRRGYADALLAAARRDTADYGLLFLVADADDWPRTWYARRGFTAIGRSHVFTRTASTPTTERPVGEPSLVELDLAQDATALAVHRVGRRAYAVEAALIGFDDIPALRESLPELRSRAGRLRWLGARTPEGRLVAFVAWQQLAGEQAGAVDIDRVCVDPDWFRRGLGSRLLRHLLTELAPGQDAVVSTGADNLPAVTLYERLGFSAAETVEPVPGLRLARFRLTRAER